MFFVDFEGMKIRICDAVEVLANVSNLKATQWGKLIEFTNAHNQKKNLVVPMKLLMNTPRSLAAELSLRGLQVNSSMQCMRLLREYLTAEYPKKTLILDYEYLWNRAIFVRPRSEMLELEETSPEVFRNVIPESKTEISNKNVIDEEQIISKLESFISKNKKFFYDLNNPNQRQLLQIVGYKKKEKGRIHYYIQQKIFKQEITENHEEMEALMQIGLLIPNENGSIYHSMKFSKGIFCAIRSVK
jgi:hypothetical protein